ncbi:MAG: efflux RND transporter periplasmic adaptor subunit [Planctomycetota bacterium]
MSTSPTNPPAEAGLGAFGRRLFSFAAYLLNLFGQPLIAVACMIGLAFLFGYAQRHYDWFQDAKTSAMDEVVQEDSLFACSMLCVFVKAPGRCPVCGMQLQEIEVPGDPKDIFGVTISPNSRRLANIETVTAMNVPISKEIEVLGKVTYDQTSEATISSYMDGRVEKLLVDFVGAKVKQGEPLAVLYSPDLYADQVGLLNAKATLEKSVSGNPRIAQTNQRLYESARRRLVELGIPDQQIDAIERKGVPESRMRINAPASGTVVQRLVEEGGYVKTGTPILKVANLSNVWLMLSMFPEDTSNLKLGQPVDVSIQSQVGQRFEGRISFIDPMVDPKTQTVSVRVEIPNDAGLIKIGDFGTAKIAFVRDANREFVVVPRESVLINGQDSVAYVETKPGRFEFRLVEVSEFVTDQVVIAKGIEVGEQVVRSGVFMLDSTFNIQGKVSLIDTERARKRNEAELAKAEAEAEEIAKAFAELEPLDRELAEVQVICPVSEVKLGAGGMGVPIRVKLAERDVMICCEGCRKPLLDDPDKYLKILDEYNQ